MSRKPQKVGKVAIVYSDNISQSSESKNLAHYFCGLLSTSGYADVVMIPFSSDGPIADLPNKRISYVPPGSTKPVEVPGSDVTYAHFSAITDCHMIVITVNSPDTIACGKRLSDALQNHKHLPIFSLQRGVRHGAVLSEEVEAKGCVMIEASIGFAVVLDPKNSSFISTLPYPGIVFERLSKEDVKVADGPLRLLETMNLEISFRKVLTPFAWGVLVYENLYALNIITKGSLRDTLANRKWRFLYATMIRENINALEAAAKGGAWAPSFLLISSMLSPKLYEFLLICPDFLFNILLYLLGSFPNPNVISPGQHDLMEGRKPMTSSYLQELVDVGKRHNTPCLACEVVMNAIQTYENSVDHRGGPKFVNYNTSNLISQVEAEIERIYPTNDTVSELQYWLVRGIAGLSFLVLLVFLFLHE